MFIPLIVSNSILVFSVIVLILLSILSYSMAKNNFDYNIYNIGNVGVIFGTMIVSYLVVIFSSGTDEIMNSFLLIGVIILLGISVIFVRTLKRTNLLIAILAIIPQIIISVIIYIVSKLIYNIIFKSE